jgi:hypothetical protein
MDHMVQKIQRNTEFECKFIENDSIHNHGSIMHSIDERCRISPRWRNDI